jgi:hypothetical protein
MSLTSYRAAPPRANVRRFGFRLSAAVRDVHLAGAFL